MAFHIGQLVQIQTLDGGKLPSAYATERKPPKLVTWTGKVLGRSVLGDDLWLIKAKGGTYTVPRREIMP
jgi:hypothetical protein